MQTEKSNGKNKVAKSEETALVASGSYAETSQAIMKITDESEFRSAMVGFELAASFVTLQKGDCFTGIMEGQGCVEIEDKETHQAKPVATWIFQTKEGKFEILGAHELDRKLNPIPKGALVRIVRGPDERVGARMVTRYEVGHRAPGSF